MVEGTAHAKIERGTFVKEKNYFNNTEIGYGGGGQQGNAECEVRVVTGNLGGLRLPLR